MADNGQGSGDEVARPPQNDAAARLVAMAAVGGGDDVGADRVARLEEKRKLLHNQRRDVLREIRNERKRRKRIMEKARTLSDAELLNVLSVRAAAAKAKPKAKACA